MFKDGGEQEKEQYQREGLAAGDKDWMDIWDGVRGGGGCRRDNPDRSDCLQYTVPTLGYCSHTLHVCWL